MDTIACARLLVRATCGIGFKCAVRKDLEQWCRQKFCLGWSKTRIPRFAHELKKTFIKWRHFTTKAHVSTVGTLLFYSQWRREGKCRPGPNIKLPPFPALKFDKNLKWKKIMFRAYSKMWGLLKHCLWKEILYQKRIRHWALTAYYFAYDVGIISSYSNRIY